LNLTSIFSFPLPLPIFVIVSTGLSFSFTYMCIQCLHYIHPSTTFPLFFSLPLVSILQKGPVPPSYSLILQKKNNDSFVCLIGSQRVSLWHFHVSQPNYFILIFLLSTFLPILCWFQQF
jgi:hypothetical protein